MIGLRKRELGLLLLGDISLFAAALYLALVIRYGALPSPYILSLHFVPFPFLFLMSVGVFFISGLYDQHTTFFKKRLPQRVFRAQAVNAVIATLFFFLIPAFGITPKTTLALYLALAAGGIILWRLVFFHRLFGRKKQKALLIGEGEEVEELMREVNDNSRYDFEFVRALDLGMLKDTSVSLEKTRALVARENISVVIADIESPEVAPLLPLFVQETILGRSLTFMQFSRMYENIFERIPLSALRADWFLLNISQGHAFYDAAKRAIDLIGAAVMGALFCVLYPFVFVAMKLEGEGPVFIDQERMGPYGQMITVYKLRTMAKSDKGAWTGETENRITKVGAVLRKTSIDELPQVWNILKGEMSMIGPRNDIIDLARRAEMDIPFYMLRYAVKPGITGWAQTHQQYAPGDINPQSIAAFRTRLAYDFYYVKHRSLLLDLNIALRTVKTLLSRFGVKLRLR